MLENPSSSRPSESHVQPGDKRKALLLICVVASTGFNLFLLPRTASGLVSGQTVLSNSWAGFGVDYSGLPGNRVDEVTGQWVVPKIQVSENVTIVTEYVQVGSDKENSGVLLLGTSQLSEHNKTFYRAFYTHFPQDSGPQIWKNFTGSVGPGTVVFADIRKSSTDTWTLGMIAQNASATPLVVTKQITFTGSEAGAEWGIYDPGSLPLANFGTITYTYENASVNGVQHDLAELPANMTLLSDSLGTCNLAFTSYLAADNKTFTVSYLTSTCPLRTAPLGSASIFYEILIGGVGVVIALLAAMIVIVATTARKKPLASIPTPTPAALCPKCGHEYKTTDRFCETCGTQRTP